MKDNKSFLFKQFSVRHECSSMKIGVDGVLIGAWGAVEGSVGLDIGCGCGLIALMSAQRNPSAEILALDIDDASVKEASLNFINSPWSSRLKAELRDVMEFGREASRQGAIDFIISNPPYFSSGIEKPATARELARHQSILSPQSLVEISSKLLKKGGSLSFIMPYEGFEELDISGLKPIRICHVADRPSKKPKRIMVELKRVDDTETTFNGTEENILYLRNEAGGFSPEYKALCKDFYLGF